MNPHSENVLIPIDKLLLLPRIKEICSDLGIQENDLLEKTQNDFSFPGVSLEMQKTLFEEYESRRQGTKMHLDT